jgi:hypothetical protein
MRIFWSDSSSSSSKVYFLFGDESTSTASNSSFVNESASSLSLCPDEETKR